MWTEANVGASEREDRGSDGLQKEFTREQANICVAEVSKKKNGSRGSENELYEVRGRRCACHDVV